MATRGALGTREQQARSRQTLSRLPNARSQANRKPESAASREFAPLVRILSREEQVYSELVDITNAERNAVVDGRLPELKVAVERKHQVLGRLADLEDRRVVWLQRYAQQRGINPLELTLASIIDASPEPDRGILARLHAGLTGRINQLKELNHRSRALLEAILHSIDASLHYLLCDDSYGQVYRPQGGLQASAVSARQLLDRRA